MAGTPNVNNGTPELHTPIPTNDMNVTLQNHPGLIQQPGLASDVSSSANQDASATSLLHATNVSSFQQSVQDNAANTNSQGVWQSLFGGAAKVVTTGLSWLNKPLQQIQQDYKFIHSVWVRHGALEGLMAAAGVAGGATLGAFTAGPEGIAAGADLAAELERGVSGFFGKTYSDSLSDATNPNYKVSFGRDLANAASVVPGLGDLKNTNTGVGKVISGLGDAAFDFNLDPLIAAGNLRTGVVQGKLLTTEEGRLITTAKGPFRSIMNGLTDFLGRNSLRVFSPDQLDTLYQAGKSNSIANMAVGNAGARYVRSLEDIASTLNDAKKTTFAQADIAQKYPGLQGIVQYLKPGTEAAPVTAEDVHKVFLQATYDQEFMKNFSVNGAAMVPNRTVVRAALSSAADKLRQWDANDALYLRGNQANFFLPRRSDKLVVEPDPATGVPTVVNTGEQQTILPVALRPWSGDAWKSAIAGKVRTFSGYLPYTIDSKTLELSNTKFDPNDPASAVSVYRIARFSMSDQLAKQMTTQFINGNIADKKDIYTGLLSEMYKAAGLPDDPALAQRIMDKSAELVHGPIDKVNYGTGFVSDNRASVAEFDGKSSPQGAFLDQRGMFTMPDFRAVKGAMREMGTYGKLYGKIDDFGRRYIDKAFKPLALLTGGFGLRIAASELIPGIMRFGSMDVAKAKIAGAAAKMNYKLAAGEDEAILENALHALSEGTDPAQYLKDAAAAAEGKTVKKTIAKGLGKLASEDDLDLASRIAIATKGHMATGATFTGYGVPAEQQEWMRQMVEILGQDSKRRFASPTGEYSFFTNSDPQFGLHYYTELSKSATTASRKQIVADALAELKSGASPDEAWEIARLKDEARIRQLEYNPDNPSVFGKPTVKDPYADERKVMAGYVNEDPTAFSARRVDIMRNLFTGRTTEDATTGLASNKVNQAFMEKVVKGVKPQLDEIKNLDPELLPKSVAGQRYDIMPGPNLTQRITNHGFEYMIDPIINNLSRQPLFFNHVKNEMRSLQYAIDTGRISEEEATRLAMTRASFAMVPQIHNTALRTQFSVLANNYLPFYFAQEQAMRRAGSLILSNPDAFRRYQLIQQGMNNPGFVQTDANGNRIVTVPYVGELGAMVLNAANRMGMPVVGGLPVNITGNLQSLKTVLPELNIPGVSPFVSIAANSIGSLDPNMEREVKKLTGGGGFSTSLFDQLMPNSIARTVYHAVNANETETTFHNAMMASMASAMYHNQVPSDDASPLERQAFLDRIKNNAKSIMIMKAIVGAVSPLSPAVTQEDLGLRSEFYKILDKKSPVTSKPMTYPEALDIFLAEHGSEAISYTISQTEGAIQGATVPYTDQAIQWIQEKKDLLNGKNAVGAAFLVPQTTSGSGDAQAIHDEVIKMHLRANKTPEQFLTSYYVAAGNNFIAAQRQAHDAAMTQLKATGQSQTAERSNWNAYVTAYGKMNPLWWDDYSSTARTHVAQVAANDLQQLFAGKSLDQIGKQYGQQASLVAQLYSDWNAHNNAVTQLRISGNSSAVTAEKDNWQAYVKNIAQQVPQLNTVVNTVFARLG